MRLAEIVEGFPRLSALVVGDICLDRWCKYDPDAAEPSRETGIPRVGVVATEVTPGAGGTIANNLAALDSKEVAVLGAVGDDGFGFELVRALQSRCISTDLLFRTSQIPTFTYTKLLNACTGIEDLPRVDSIYKRPMPASVERAVVELLLREAARFDVILVSDQAETEQGGVVTAQVRGALAEIAARNPRKVIWADSRKRGELFRKVIVKPNRDEAEAACSRVFGCVDYQRLREHLAAPFLIVTDGARGSTVVDNSGETLVATKPVNNPVDICGAGDSFSAAGALALAVTGSALAAAHAGNLAASVTIMKKGTGTVSRRELLASEGA